jgi:hypothetical protein
VQVKERSQKERNSIALSSVRPSSIHTYPAVGVARTTSFVSFGVRDNVRAAYRRFRVPELIG